MNANLKKKAIAAVLMSDKMGFKTKMIIRNKEDHYNTIRGQSDKKIITVVNIYASKIGALQHIKQILTNKMGNTNTIIVGDFIPHIQALTIRTHRNRKKN